VGPRCECVRATAGAAEPKMSDNNRSNVPKRMVRGNLMEQYDTETVQIL